MRYEEVDEGIFVNLSEFIGQSEHDYQVFENELSGLNWELYNDVPYVNPAVADFNPDAFQRQINLVWAQLREESLPIEQLPAGLRFSTMVRDMNNIFRGLYDTAMENAQRYSNLSAEGTDGPSFNYAIADPRYRDRRYEGWTLELVGLNNL